MSRHRILRRAAVSAIGLGCAVGVVANGATLDDIFAVAERINAQARTSQGKIEALTDETRKLYTDYKVVLDEIEGLRVYKPPTGPGRSPTRNRNWRNCPTRSTASLSIERQITPLMLRMIDGLEEFVRLDLPFLLNERRDRIERLRTIMDRADVAVSEKFSQVLQAYQIEKRVRPHDGGVRRHDHRRRARASSSTC